MGNRQKEILVWLAASIAALAILVALAASNAHGASLSAGQALQRPPASRGLADCRWRLSVTGGQAPGSDIVLHLTNVCYRGGPQRTIRVGPWTLRSTPGGLRSARDVPLPDVGVLAAH